MLLISGSSNIALAENISVYLDIPLVPCILGKFKNGEIRVEISETVRGGDVVIIQTGYSNLHELSVNDIIMETCLLIDACNRSMVSTITLIMPLYPYSRQDKKDSSRSPISAAFLAKMFETMGINRIVCMDLHSAQIQGFFSCPVDNLYTIKLVNQKLHKLYNINNPNIRKNFVLVSPDSGAVKRTLKFARVMGLKTVIMHKERDYSHPGTVIKTVMVCDCLDDFTGKVAIITDDMIDSGGTFIKACETLTKRGFYKVIGVITHGYFTGDAIKNIMACSAITRIIVTNTICQKDNLIKCPKMEILDVTSHLAEAIKRIHDGGSLSDLF